MEYIGPLLVVKDLEVAKNFYEKVLGLEVILDFGANITLTGGIALQTYETWRDFIHKPSEEVHFGGMASELYFEETDFDAFMNKLNSITHINYVHEVKEHGWGQRVVRFYDPDQHIIEVGENMKAVVTRFMNKGLSIKETAKRMDVSIEYINSFFK